MLRISVRQRKIHHHLGHDRTQPRDHPARLVEQPHVGIASGKITVGVREKRHGLDRNPQPRACLLEMSAEDQSASNQERLLPPPRPRAEAHGPLSTPYPPLLPAAPPPPTPPNAPSPPPL